MNLKYDCGAGLNENTSAMREVETVPSRLPRSQPATQHSAWTGIARPLVVCVALPNAGHTSRRDQVGNRVVDDGLDSGR